MYQYYLTSAEKAPYLQAEQMALESVDETVERGNSLIADSLKKVMELDDIQVFDRKLSDITKYAAIAGGILLTILFLKSLK